MSASDKATVRVAVRVRPLTEREKTSDGNDHRSILDIQNGDTLTIRNPVLDGLSQIADSRQAKKCFIFDYIYWSLHEDSPNYASQERIFNELGTMVLDAAFEGYNACIFAYGQTGSGKTYTMMGNPDDLGMIPRTAMDLIRRANSQSTEEEDKASYDVAVSYFEIYNEKVRDLLRPSLKNFDQPTLRVRENPTKGPYVQNLTVHHVRESDKVVHLIDIGNELRTTAETHMHDRSSRSHAIFRITFTQRRSADDNTPSEVTSTINLVDLAGSERANPVYDKRRIIEGSNINKSLLTLGTVIKCLAEKALRQWSQGQEMSSDSAQGSHENLVGSSSSIGSTHSLRQHSLFIPYRDSILTWLLKDSLGGNAKTVMIATVSPSSQCYSETLSTLRYAQQAKCIVNKPVINEDAHIKLIRKLKLENASLLLKLQEYRVMAARWGSGGSIEIDNWRESKTVAIQTPATAYLEQQLEQNALQMQELTKSVFEKWSGSESSKSSQSFASSEPRVVRRVNSLAYILDSDLPNLMSLNDSKDNGVIIYPLKDGETTFSGSTDSPMFSIDDFTDEDVIVLEGADIQLKHASIISREGEIVLYPEPDAPVYVNNQLIMDPTDLYHGDFVCFGQNALFLFKNPRNQQKRSLDNPPGTCSDSHSLPLLPIKSSSLTSLNALQKSDKLLLPAPGHLIEGPSWSELCTTMEDKHVSESERIAEAKKDLQSITEEKSAASEWLEDEQDELQRRRDELEREWRQLRQQREHFEREKAAAERDLTSKRKWLDKYRKWLEDKAATGELSADSSKDPEAVWQAFVRHAVESAGGELDGDLGHLDIPQDEFGNILPIAEVFGGLNPASKDDCALVEADLKAQEQRLAGTVAEQKERIDAELIDLEKKEEQYKAEVSRSLEMAAERRHHIEQLQHRESQLQYYLMVTRHKIDQRQNPTLAGYAPLDSGQMKRAVSSPGLSLEAARLLDQQLDSRDDDPSSSPLQLSLSNESINKASPLASPSGTSLTKKAADVTARLTANIKAKQPVVQHNVKDKSRGRPAEKSKPSSPAAAGASKPPTNKAQAQPAKQTNKPVVPTKDPPKKGKLAMTRRSTSSLADIPEPIAEETGEDAEDNEDANSLCNSYPRRSRHWSVERVQQISESFKKSEKDRDKSPLVLARPGADGDKKNSGARSKVVPSDKKVKQRSHSTGSCEELPRVTKTFKRRSASSGSRKSEGDDARPKKPRTSIMDIIKNIMPHGTKRQGGDVPVEIFVSGEGKVLDAVIPGNGVTGAVRTPKSDSGNSSMSRSKFNNGKENACQSDSLESGEEEHGQDRSPVLDNDGLPMSEDSLDEDAQSLDATVASGSFFLSDDSSRHSARSGSSWKADNVQGAWPPTDSLTLHLPHGSVGSPLPSPLPHPSDYADLMSDDRTSDWSTASKRARWNEKARLTDYPVVKQSRQKRKKRMTPKQLPTESDSDFADARPLGISAALKLRQSLMPSNSSNAKSQPSLKMPNSNSSSSDELWSSDDNKGAQSDGLASGDEAVSVATAGGGDNISDVASAHTAHTSLAGSLDNLLQSPSLTGSAGSGGKPTLRKLVRSRLDCWSSTSPEPRSGLLGGLGARISTVSECPQSSSMTSRDVVIVRPCRLAASQVRTCDLVESVSQCDGFMVTFDGLWSPADIAQCNVSVNNSDVVSGVDALLPRVPVNSAEVVADQTHNAITLQGQQQPHSLPYSRDSGGLLTGELGQEPQFIKDDVTGISHVGEEMAMVEEMEVNLANVGLSVLPGVASEVFISSKEKLTEDVDANSESAPTAMVGVMDTGRLSELPNKVLAIDADIVGQIDDQLIDENILAKPSQLENEGLITVATGVSSNEVPTLFANDDSMVNSGPVNCITGKNDVNASQHSTSTSFVKDFMSSTTEFSNKGMLALGSPSPVARNEVSHLEEMPANAVVNELNILPVDSGNLVYNHIEELNGLERYTVDNDSKAAVLEEGSIVYNEHDGNDFENITENVEPQDVLQQDGIVRDYVVELHGLEKYTVDSDSGIMAMEVSDQEDNDAIRENVYITLMPDDNSISKLNDTNARNGQLDNKSMPLNTTQLAEEDSMTGVMKEQQPPSQEILILWSLERYTEAAVSSEYRTLEKEQALEPLKADKVENAADKQGNEQQVPEVVSGIDEQRAGVNSGHGVDTVEGEQQVPVSDKQVLQQLKQQEPELHEETLEIQGNKQILASLELQQQRNEMLEKLQNAQQAEYVFVAEKCEAQASEQQSQEVKEQQQEQELKDLQLAKELEQQLTFQQQQQQSIKKLEEQEMLENAHKTQEQQTAIEVNPEQLSEGKQLSGELMDTKSHSSVHAATDDIEMNEGSEDRKNAVTPENMTVVYNKLTTILATVEDKGVNRECNADITDMPEGNYNATVDQPLPASQIDNSRPTHSVVSKQALPNDSRAVTQVNVTGVASELPNIDFATGDSTGGSSATVEDNSPLSMKGKGQQSVAGTYDSAHEEPHSDDCGPLTTVQDNNSSEGHEVVANANDRSIDAAPEVAAILPCDTREEDEVTALGSIYGGNEAVSSDDSNQRLKSNRPLFTANVDIPGQSGSAALYAHASDVAVTCEEIGAVGQAVVPTGLLLASSHSLPSDRSELTIIDTARPLNFEDTTTTATIVPPGSLLTSGLKRSRKESSGEVSHDDLTSSGEQTSADDRRTGDKIEHDSQSVLSLLADGTLVSDIGKKQQQGSELYAEEWVDQLEVYFPVANSAGYTAVLEVEERDAADSPLKVKDVCDDVLASETPTTDPLAESEVPVVVSPAAEIALSAAVCSESELPATIGSTVDAAAMDTVSQGVFFASIFMPVMETNTQGLVSEQVPMDEDVAGVREAGDGQCAVMASDGEPAGADDVGRFELVHFKAPEPKQLKGRGRGRASGDPADGDLQQSRLQVVDKQDFDDLAQAMLDARGSTYAIESIVEPPVESDTSDMRSIATSNSFSQQPSIEDVGYDSPSPLRDNADNAINGPAKRSVDDNDAFVDYIEGVMKKSWTEARRMSLEMNIDDTSDVGRRMSDLDSDRAPSSHVSVSGADDLSENNFGHHSEDTMKLKRSIPLELETALNEMDATMQNANKPADSNNGLKTLDTPATSTSDVKVVDEPATSTNDVEALNKTVDSVGDDNELNNLVDKRPCVDQLEEENATQHCDSDNEMELPSLQARHKVGSRRNSLLVALEVGENGDQCESSFYTEQSRMEQPVLTSTATEGLHNALATSQLMNGDCGLSRSQDSGFQSVGLRSPDLMVSSDYQIAVLDSNTKSNDLSNRHDDGNLGNLEGSRTSENLRESQDMQTAESNEPFTENCQARKPGRGAPSAASSNNEIASKDKQGEQRFVSSDGSAGKMPSKGLQLLDSQPTTSPASSGDEVSSKGKDSRLSSGQTVVSSAGTDGEIRSKDRRLSSSQPPVSSDEEMPSRGIRPSSGNLSVSPSDENASKNMLPSDSKPGVSFGDEVRNKGRRPSSGRRQPISSPGSGDEMPTMARRSSGDVPPISSPVSGDELLGTSVGNRQSADRSQVDSGVSSDYTTDNAELTDSEAFSPRSSRQFLPIIPALATHLQENSLQPVSLRSRESWGRKVGESNDADPLLSAIDVNSATTEEYATASVSGRPDDLVKGVGNSKTLFSYQPVEVTTDHSSKDNGNEDLMGNHYQPLIQKAELEWSNIDNDGTVSLERVDELAELDSSSTAEESCVSEQSVVAAESMVTAKESTTALSESSIVQIDVIGDKVIAQTTSSDEVDGVAQQEVVKETDNSMGSDGEVHKVTVVGLQPVAGSEQSGNSQELSLETDIAEPLTRLDNLEESNMAIEVKPWNTDPSRHCVMKAEIVEKVDLGNSKTRQFVNRENGCDGEMKRTLSETGMNRRPSDLAVPLEEIRSANSNEGLMSREPSQCWEPEDLSTNAALERSNRGLNSNETVDESATEGGISATAGGLNRVDNLADEAVKEDVSNDDQVRKLGENQQKQKVVNRNEEAEIIVNKQTASGYEDSDDEVETGVNQRAIKNRHGKHNVGDTVDGEAGEENRSLCGAATDSNDLKEIEVEEVDSEVLETGKDANKSRASSRVSVEALDSDNLTRKQAADDDVRLTTDKIANKELELADKEGVDEADKNKASSSKLGKTSNYLRKDMPGSDNNKQQAVVTQDVAGSDNNKQQAVATQDVAGSDNNKQQAVATRDVTGSDNNKQQAVATQDEARSDGNKQQAVATQDVAGSDNNKQQAVVTRDVAGSDNNKQQAVTTRDEARSDNNKQQAVATQDVAGSDNNKQQAVATQDEARSDNNKQQAVATRDVAGSDNNKQQAVATQDEAGSDGNKQQAGAEQGGAMEDVARNRAEIHQPDKRKESNNKFKETSIDLRNASAGIDTNKKVEDQAATMILELANSDGVSRKKHANEDEAANSGTPLLNQVELTSPDVCHTSLPHDDDENVSDDFVALHHASWFSSMESIESFDLDLFRAQVSELPDMLTEECTPIRVHWEDQRAELQRSFSTSVVHLLTQSCYASLRPSASVDCLNLLYERLTGLPLSEDVIPPSPAINQSHSLNWLSGRRDTNLESRMTRPQSMPVHIDDSTCRYLYGIDSTVLPMSEKSVSAEDIRSLMRGGNSREGLFDKHKSISLDSSKFNNDDDEVTPENVFGGPPSATWSQIEITSQEQWETVPKGSSSRLGGNAMGSTSTLVMTTPRRTTSTVDCATQVEPALDELRQDQEAKSLTQQPSKEESNNSREQAKPIAGLDVNQPLSTDLRNLLEQALAMVQQGKAGQLALGLSSVQCEHGQAVDMSTTMEGASVSVQEDAVDAVEDLIVPQVAVLPGFFTAQPHRRKHSGDNVDGIVGQLKPAIVGGVSRSATAAKRKPGEEGEPADEMGSDEGLEQALNEVQQPKETTEQAEIENDSDNEVEGENYYNELDVGVDDESMLNNMSSAAPAYVRTLDRWESEEILSKRLSQLRHSEGQSDPMLARNRRFFSQQLLSDPFGSQRTIETQTYPDVRVIETQTKVDGATTTLDMDLGDVMSPGLGTQVKFGSFLRLVDIGVGASPPRSPTPTAESTNVLEISQEEVYTSEGKHNKASFVAVAEGLPTGSYDGCDILFSDDEPVIAIPDIELSSDDDDIKPAIAVPTVPATGSTTLPVDTQNPPRVRAPLPTSRFEAIPPPATLKSGPSLEELRREHERFVRFMEQSKEERAQAKARIKEQIRSRQRQFQADRASASTYDLSDSVLSPHAWDSMSSLLLSPTELTNFGSLSQLHKGADKKAGTGEAAKQSDSKKPTQLIINIERDREIVIQGSLPAKVVKQQNELSLEDIEKDSLIDSELTPPRRLNVTVDTVNNNQLQVPGLVDKFRYTSGSMQQLPSSSSDAAGRQALGRDFGSGSSRNDPLIGSDARYESLKARSMESVSSVGRESDQSSLARRRYDPEQADDRRRGQGQANTEREAIGRALPQPSASRRSPPSVKVNSRSISAERLSSNELSATEMKRFMQRYETIRRLIEEDDDLDLERPLSRTSVASSSLYEVPETRSPERRGDSPQKRVHFNAEAAAAGFGSRAQDDAFASGNNTRPTESGRSASVGRLESTRVASSSTKEMREAAMETDRIASGDIDELERLRRERERVRAILAKDLLPSRTEEDVESAEAQLNYLIGQTDVLLTSLDEPWEMDVLERVSYKSPESQRSTTIRTPLDTYRMTLMASERQLEERIRVLERKINIPSTPAAATFNTQRQASQLSSSSMVSTKSGSSSSSASSTLTKAKKEAMQDAFQRERRSEQTRHDVLQATFARRDDTISSSSMSQAAYEPLPEHMTALERAQYFADVRKRLFYGFDQPIDRTPHLVNTRLLAANRVRDDIDQTLDEVYGTHSDDLIKRHIMNCRWPTTPGHYAAAPPTPLADLGGGHRIGLARDLSSSRSGHFTATPSLAHRDFSAGRSPYTAPSGDFGRSSSLARPGNYQSGYSVQMTAAQHHSRPQPTPALPEMSRGRSRQDFNPEIRSIVQKYTDYPPTETSIMTHHHNLPFSRTRDLHASPLQFPGTSVTDAVSDVHLFAPTPHLMTGARSRSSVRDTSASRRPLATGFTTDYTF